MVGIEMRDPVRRIYPQANTPRETLLKEFEKIMANDRNQFTSNPSKAFLVPDNWTGEEMTFYLIDNDDDKFIYVVRIGGRFFSNYFLYYWKKHSINQEGLNEENLLASNKRWTDTMHSSRTGQGGYNPIRAILQEIGINTAETI